MPRCALSVGSAVMSTAPHDTDICALPRRCVPRQAIKFINEQLAEGIELAAQRGRPLVLKFDGDTIGPTATPNSLGLEDDDVIDVS